METSFHCDHCKQTFPTPAETLRTGTGGTGYARTDKGKCCYKCCAIEDIKYMRENGKISLYLVDPPGEQSKVQNWPGTLSFNTGPVKKSRHNIARVRYDAWFTGPDGETWHGVQYGDMTQIIHCKRLQSKSRAKA